MLMAGVPEAREASLAYRKKMLARPSREADSWALLASSASPLVLAMDPWALPSVSEGQTLISAQQFPLWSRALPLEWAAELIFVGPPSPRGRHSLSSL